MSGAVNVVVENQLERPEVLSGGVVDLGAGKIKSNNTAMFERNRQFCHSQRRFGAHRTNAAKNHAEANAEVAVGHAKASKNGFDDIGQTHARTGMKHRGVANLDVANAFIPRVFGQLIRGSDQALFALHDRESDVERLEVVVEGTADVARIEQLEEPVRIFGWQFDLLLFCQVQDSAETQRAVEVDVKVGLGKAFNEVEAEDRHAAL